MNPRQISETLTRSQLEKKREGSKSLEEDPSAFVKVYMGWLFRKPKIVLRGKKEERDGRDFLRIRRLIE